MTEESPRTSEIAALTEALRTRAAVRVNLDELWPLWAQAAPRLIGSPHQAAALAVALGDLSGSGVIELPAHAWDTSTTPPLPRTIAVVGARRPPRDRAWIRFPWRAELGWAASLPSLSDARLRDLIAINDWLAKTADTPSTIVPVRYRSVEVLGDEKALDALAKTAMFAADRLNLDLLACRRVPPPLPAAQVGPGPDLLVVENSDTFWVAMTELRALTGHPIGRVAWGSGNSFPSQVETLTVDVAGQGPIRGTVWYWGDLDPAGLTIAADAHRVADSIGAPAIKPASALWEAMSSRPLQDVGHISWPDNVGHNWLGPNLWDALVPVRDAAARVAQEAVPSDHITRWASSLSHP
ncbi:hypothetical protein AB0M47_29510 [Hamadaea sp. NPDC051192]|uniref:hypothetical protein n=1 Tax=Hamadaea sp. NPDC051192 TaxID=3154940 RepID=UPI003417CBF0